VRLSRVFQQAQALQRTVVERVELDVEAGVLVGHVRPHGAARPRCGRCGRRGPWADRGGGRRRWRGLDFGTLMVELEADAPRVSCPQHGVTVVGLPWARHRAGHTYAFDDLVAWLAVRTSRTAVERLLRIAWRTVGAIVARVAADGRARTDRWANLRRIGIDEVSYKRHHHYLVVVVDHDSGQLVWAAPGRDKATLGAFFDALGTERSNLITHVSADGADWVSDVVAKRCPNAVLGADPYHVVSWATTALDQVRREAWNAARGGKGGTTSQSKALKKARWAMWRNPEDLTDAQYAKLGWIAKTHPKVHRAWALKEGLRMVFVFARQGYPLVAKKALSRWICWAQRCQIPAFVKLAKTVVAFRDAIHISIDHKLSNVWPSYCTSC
jgi:transposase